MRSDQMGRPGQVQAQPMQKAEQRTEQTAVMGKVSKRLLWFLFLLFIFSFLDRINIGFAGLTMMKDLQLSSTQFGLATTLFYVAYIVFGIPSNMALARIGTRRWIALIMIGWGLASTATMFASDPVSLYVLRMLVGITEAGFLPGMLLYLTYWFPAAYRARANALFMIAMPVTAMLGSILSGFILSLDGVGALKGWQWLFLLEGLPSVVLGIAVYFYLDDKPQQSGWLASDEKRLLLEMLDHDRHAGTAASAAAASQERAVSGPGALLRELCSPAVIKFGIAYFCLVNSLAMVAVWTPLIVKSFSSGASNITVGLLAAIPQVCTVVAMIWWGRHSDRRQERRWHTMLPMLVSACGWVLTATSGHLALQLAGVCLASAGAYTAMSVFWTMPDRVLSWSARALGIAVINAVGNISSALNPLIVGWLRDATHSFSTGLLYASVLLLIGTWVTWMLTTERPT